MRKERLVVGIFMGLVGSLTLFDILGDLDEGSDLQHLILEGSISVSAFLTTFYLWFQMKKEKSEVAKLAKEKLILQEIADQYQQKSKVFVDGLGVQIDTEFSKWSLSEAERDIGLLLLKGLSPKKIAEIRSSSEKTVRTQISSIYRKAAINGREEFTAHFLEDFLNPVTHEINQQ